MERYTPPQPGTKGEGTKESSWWAFPFLSECWVVFCVFLKIAGHLMVLFSGFCLVLCNSGSRRPLKGPCGEDPSEQNICVSLEEKTVKKKKRCNLELEQSKCSAR